MENGKLEIKQLAVGGFDDNFSYLGVAENGDAFIVDPAGDAEVIRQAAAHVPGLRPRYILLTHRHRDHYSALREVLKFFPAPVLEHANLADGQLLPVGDQQLQVIFTPGHTADSVCYRLTDDTALFTGDTLFVGYIGFCEPASMYRSLYEILGRLAGSNVIYSGHNYGSAPTDTLEHQRHVNPWLRCQSYPEFLKELKNLT